MANAALAMTVSAFIPCLLFAALAPESCAVLNADEEASRAFEEATEARVLWYGIDRPADVVVTSAGGYPLDATFYQAVKGAVTAAGAVRAGGVVILAASLSEGVGSPEFQDLFRLHADPETFLDRTTHSPEVHVDQWQAQMLAQAERRAEVWVYSDGLSSEELGSLYVKPLASPEEGIDRARTMFPGECSILYLPEGPYVVPVLRERRGQASPPGPA